jgi:ketosteroid isomerase-like protein
MSKENAEIVKRALAAWSERDVETATALCLPDVEIVPAFASAVEGRTFHGPDAVAEFFRSVDSFFDSFSTESESVRPLDGDRVLVLGRVRAHARASGVEVDQQWGSLWELDEGRIARIQTFFDHEAARRAAGLSE